MEKMKFLPLTAILSCLMLVLSLVACTVGNSENTVSTTTAGSTTSYQIVSESKDTTSSEKPDLPPGTNVTDSSTKSTVGNTAQTTESSVITTCFTTTQREPSVTTYPTTSRKDPPVIVPTTTEKPKPPATTTTTSQAEPETPAIGTNIRLTYNIGDVKGGTLSGSLSQNVRYGLSSSSRITANAKLGYKFVKWSDGLTTPTRSGDCPTEDTNYTAIFALDTKELPILMITTSTGRDVDSKDEYIAGTISVYNTEEKYLLDSLEMQIRGRGNYTWRSTFNSDPMYNKRPYRMKLSEKQKLCGVGEGKNKDWVLLADHCDQSLLRNNIVYTFAKSLEHIYWQPSVQSVEVYLNGEYHGVYLLCEQVEVNKHKVNISENLTEAEIAFFVMYSGYTDLSTFESFEMGGNKYEIKSDLSDGQNLASSQKQYIINYMKQCWDAVQSGDQKRIEVLIDIDSLIDSYIVHELFKNLDTGWDNFYMSKDLGGKLSFGPVWDFDQCSGNANEGIDDPTGIRGGNTQPWYSSLLRHKWFRKMLVQRWNELKDRIDKVPALIISNAEAGYNSYCRNFEKWKIFGYKINRETYVRQFRSYKEHYEYFAGFVTSRISWLDSYFNDPAYYFDGELTLKGQGTPESPYIIGSAEDFLNFTLCLKSGDTFSGKFFKQSTDIDMSTVSAYTGAGASCLFAGCYDGAGHVINVSIHGNDECVFPYVSGTVMNVITTGTINNSGISAGVARSVRSGGKIVNCISYMNISSSSNVAGIVASNQNGAVIAGCFFGGTLNSPANIGPINAWVSGRPGVFTENYYLSSVNNNTGNVGNGQVDTAVDRIDSNLLSMLIGSADTVSMASNIAKDTLCTFGLENGKIVFVTKQP